jgi:hypothetical protein
MSEQRTPESTDGMSRRMLLAGGLAVAASAVASAVAPEVAAANAGDIVHVGDVAYGYQTVFPATTTGTSGADPVTYAILNYHSQLYQSQTVAGLYGCVYPTAKAGSAGVLGVASPATSFAVQALHTSPAGTALKVEGRAAFSRSGVGTIAKKHSSLTVTVPTGVDTTSMILATLQGSGGSGVYLKYAKRMTATTFKVALNKKAKSAVTFAWMILG